MFRRYSNSVSVSVPGSTLYRGTWYQVPGTLVGVRLVHVQCYYLFVVVRFIFLFVHVHRSSFLGFRGCV